MAESPADRWEAAPSGTTGDRLPPAVSTAGGAPEEPPARPPEAPAATPEPAGFAGSYEISAGPFAKFATMNALFEKLQAIDGVREVRMGRFQRGILDVGVDYDGTVPLTDRLTTLEGLPLSVTSVDGKRIQLTLTA